MTPELTGLAALAVFAVVLLIFIALYGVVELVLGRDEDLEEAERGGWNPRGWR